MIVSSDFLVNEQMPFEFQTNIKVIYEYFQNLATKKKINFEYQLHFEEFDFNENKIIIFKTKKQKQALNLNANRNFSMSNINISFPQYMKGNRKRLIKTIEILLTNALNET